MFTKLFCNKLLHSSLVLVPTATNSNLSVRLFSVTSAHLNLNHSASVNVKGSKEIIQEKIKLATNLEINYGKIGHGPKVVLCIPGVFGTIESDFEPIMKKFDQDQFTVLCIDPPGQGKSRPPLRPIGKRSSAKDAEVVELLMKTLEIPKYSIVGWSNGGTTGLLLIANKRSNIENFIFWGTPAFIDSYMVKVSQLMLNPAYWIPARWKMMSSIYGEGLMLEMLEGFHDYVSKAEKDGNFRIDLVLPSITVPTLILHGKIDMSCPIEHPHTYHELIPNSILEVWSKGQHDLHLEFPDRFVKRVEKFLLTSR